MEYTIRFRLDVKNNVYISKKRASAEPYFQISAIIRINRNCEIHYFIGYSALKSAWFGKAEDAHKGDGNRTCGIHKNHTAKCRTRIVQYTEVNRAIDLVSGKLASLSNKVNNLSKEELIKALNEELGKCTSKKEDETAPTQPIETINTLWTLVNLYCEDRTVTDGRNKTRRNAMSHFKNFEAYRKEEITFLSCNAKLLTDFQCYLQTDDGTDERYKHIKNSIQRPRKKNRNTISKILTATKHFFTWCRKRYGVEGIGNVYDFQVPTPMYGDPVTLTLDEKRRLFDTCFNDPDMEYIRDLFYFQCSIGCRVSDFFKLKYENLILDNEKWCIKYLPKKTKGVTSIACRVPLSQKAMHILNKYKVENVNLKTPLFAFPKNPQTYNDQLKRIFKIADLNRIVTTYNVYGEEEFVPLYSLAKSKFARSCFIDVLVGQGLTDNIIATMSGHKAGSNAFHRYHNSLKIEQQNRAVMLLD